MSGAMDSLDLVELVLEFEEKGIVTPEDLVWAFQSRDDLIEYLRSRLEESDQDKA